MGKRKTDRVVATLFVTFITLAFTGCMSNSYFCGDLVNVDDTNKYTKAKAEVIPIDSVHEPVLAVVDSFVMFYNTYSTGRAYSYDLYSLKTGKYVCGLFPIGHGAGEFVGIAPIKQIYEENGEKKALIFAPNELTMAVCNMTKTLQKKKAVYEKKVKYTEKSLPDRHYSRVFQLDKDRFAAYIASEHVPGTHLIKPSEYQVLSFSTGKILDRIQVVDAMQESEKSVVLTESFFSTSYGIKPDRTKIVGSLLYVPQINIINLKNKEVKGFLVKGGPDYTIFDTDMNKAKLCFPRVVCDDKHIFALWSGRPDEGKDYEWSGLYVFNWKGKLEGKVKLSHAIKEVFLDDEHGILYGSNEDKKEIYAYKVNDFF